MKTKKNEPKVKVSEGEYSPVYIHCLYKLMLFRHLKEYSTQDVSYLLGKKSRYVEELEGLKSLSNRIEAIFPQTMKLGTLQPVDLFSRDIFEIEAFRRYRVTVSKKRECILYKIEVIEDEAPSLAFSFTERIPSSNHFFSVEEEVVEKLRIVLGELINAGYFLEKIETYQLYQKCLDDYALHIRPVVLRDIMIELTKREDTKVCLKYDNIDHFGFRYYYIQEGDL